MSEDVHMGSGRGFEGMDMEERVKALRKPRSLAHRAQSLDIGALAAQQAAQQGNLSAGPATPYGLGPIGSGGPAASPGFPGMGAPQHSFPLNSHFAQASQQRQQPQQHHLSGHHPHPHPHHHASTASISRLPPPPNAQNPEPTTMDEVSRVLAQLAFDRP
jgi:hypothetical protein